MGLLHLEKVQASSQRLKRFMYWPTPKGAPQHLVIDRNKGDWKGKVVHVEHLGADTNIYLDLAGAGLITVRENGEAPRQCAKSFPLAGKVAALADGWGWSPSVVRYARIEASGGAAISNGSICHLDPHP